MATKLRILVGAVLVAGIALVPTPAHAKGAGSAKITGPGLDQPIRLGSWEVSAGESQISGSELGDAAGLYTAAFGTAGDVTPGDVAPERPDGALGARYIVKYRFMTGQDENLEYEYETIRQELYPFAREGGVSYTPPGQELFDRPVTAGWYRAGPELRDLLVVAGVPEPRRS